MIGNPLSNTNFFFRFCKRGDMYGSADHPGLLRKVIHVDGLDSPNVQLGIKWRQAGKAGKPPIVIPGLLAHDEYLRREASYDEVQRTTRLHGHFYEGDQAMLFPIAWLETAMDCRRWAELRQQPRRVQAIGVDVAAGGRDSSCWTLIDEHGVIEQIVLNLANTMEIVGRTIALIREHKINSYRVAMDAGGGGKQLADRLSEQGCPVTLVGFGEAAKGKHTFKNRRAEMYGLLRERLKPEGDQAQFALPPEAYDLQRELAVLPLVYDSEGRMLLPPKSRSSARQGEISIEKLLGRSPDRADSLALAVWMLDRYRYRGRPDHSQHVYWEPSWTRPPTPEQIAALPQELREICEATDRCAHEWRSRRRWRDEW